MSLAGFHEKCDDRVDPLVHAAEAVGVAVVPGRVGLEELGERGEVALREAVEAARTTAMSASAAVAVVICGSFAVGPRHRTGAAARRTSTVQSILDAVSPLRIANIARPARVETPRCGVRVDGRRRDHELRRDLALDVARPRGGAAPGPRGSAGSAGAGAPGRVADRADRVALERQLGERARCCGRVDARGAARRARAARRLPRDRRRRRARPRACRRDSTGAAPRARGGGSPAVERGEHRRAGQCRETVHADHLELVGSQRLTLVHPGRPATAPHGRAAT